MDSGSRPGWPDIWADVARAVARRSRCSRSRVGCVIVDTRQRVLATSYNGPPANYGPARRNGDCRVFCERARSGPTDETASNYADCPANHAEINGLMMTDRSDREGGAIYVTGHLCLGCAKAVANSGLTCVWLVDADDELEAHRAPARSEEMLRQSGLRVRRIGG